MNLIKKIDAAYCVILDKRIDFWPELKREFNKKGIDLQKFVVGDGKTLSEKEYDYIDVNYNPTLYSVTNFYPSWVNKPNAYNAFLSHRKIIDMCYIQNKNNVLIIEDDVFIESDFDEIMKNIDGYFDSHDFDMIQFGGYHAGKTKEILPNLLKTTDTGGWHGVLINRSLFRILLSFLPVGPFDWICGQYLQQKYDCYCIYPSIISQKDGYSYVESSQLSKPSRYQKC